MLSYQHIYHAGNLADVHKHALLCAVLFYLTQKYKPLCYIETHAGRALYDLKSEEALKTGEASAGIEHLLKAGKLSLNAQTPYARALKHLRNKYGKDTYPGSPLFAAQFLRPQDTAHVAELHPQEIKHLEVTLQRCDKKMHIHHEDGFKMADALIPPMPRRGLLMIDPSYEVKSEYEKTAAFIQKMHKKWPVGIIALWYPILPENLHVPMIKALKETAPDALCHEVSFKAIKNHRLQGSGMLLLNPPYKIEEACKEITRMF